MWTNYSESKDLCHVSPLKRSFSNSSQVGTLVGSESDIDDYPHQESSSRIPDTGHHDVVGGFYSHEPRTLH
jgi:hypothetical protein